MKGTSKKVLGIWIVFIMIVMVLGVSCSQQTQSTTPTLSSKATPTMDSAKAAAAPTPQYGGILKIITPKTVSTFGYPPVMGPDGESYSYPCVEHLSYFDMSGEFTPKLATDWEITPGGKSIKLHLRKGVKFHDGTDFNADTVKYNLELIRKSRGELKDVTSIEIIDPYTIQLSLSNYNNLLVMYLSSMAGIQISPTALDKNGLEWAKVNPVGTGPYKFKEFQRDVFIKYERFNDYWGGKPYLDGMEYYFKSDVTTAKMAFLAGEGQVLAPTTPKDAIDLKSQGYNIVLSLSAQNELFPSSNNPNSPFADKRVREALEYAIDKNAIVKGPGYGFWQANYQMTPPNVVGYNPDLKPRNYDPEKAKQLLKEAGYPNGFQTTLFARAPADDAIVPIITYLKNVGIDAKLDVANMTRITSIKMEGWEGLLFLGVGIDPNVLHRIEGELGVRQKAYVSTLRPPEFQSTLDAAMASTDLESRKTLTQKLSKLIYDNVMIVPIYQNAEISAQNKYIKDCNLDTDHYVHWVPAKAWLSK
jgi:peptide/nickel transport system substrate-binding protein